ncbi:MAG: hypothetical protein QE278_13755 [Limnobacter sp.]|nr:hypothetical protein [Limnobacter sp.]
MKVKVLPIIISSLLIPSGGAFAQQICSQSFSFSAQVTSTSGTTSSTPVLCSSKADTFIDSFESIESVSNAYQSKTEGVNINARFADISLQMSYQPNSAVLNFSFPELGVNERIVGQGANVVAARDNAEDQFVEFIKKTNLAGRILKAQAQSSPSSAISGAGGLIPNMIANDFAVGTSGPVSLTGKEPTSNENLIGVGADAGSYKLDNSGGTVNVTSLPLSYTVRFDSNPSRQLIFSLPLTLTEIDGAQSYQTGLGMALRLPVQSNWAITPAVKYGVVGSEDRATVAGVYSATLSSVYGFEALGLDMAIGNMVGIYQTSKFTAGEYSFDPDVKNSAFRNGLLVSQPVNVFGKKLAVEYSVIDTRYFGSEKPFMKEFQEVGVTIGNNRNALDNSSYVRAGVGYQTGKGSEAIKANVGYWF